ncbi:hypothetical protein HN51_007078, partial [Arachis hypogaea]
KLVLAARSPVFKAQICGPVKDQNTDCINTGYNFSTSRAASLFSAESILSQVYCNLRKPQ